MICKKASPLAALLFGTLGVCASAQEIPKNLGIPERFNNYRTKSQVSYSDEIEIGEVKFFVKSYTFDGEQRASVREIYLNHIMTSKKNPVFYAFDLSENGQFEYDEILMDKKKNGLDGKEVWISRVKHALLDEVFEN